MIAILRPRHHLISPPGQWPTVWAGSFSLSHVPPERCLSPSLVRSSLRAAGGQNRPRFSRGFGATNAKFPSDHSEGMQSSELLIYEYTPIRNHAGSAKAARRSANGARWTDGAGTPWMEYHDRREDRVFVWRHRKFASFLSASGTTAISIGSISRLEASRLSHDVVGILSVDRWKLRRAARAAMAKVDHLALGFGGPDQSPLDARFLPWPISRTGVRSCSTG